jgi:hypothetical protein
MPHRIVPTLLMRREDRNFFCAEFLYLGFFPPGTSADRMIDGLRPQLAITQR